MQPPSHKVPKYSPVGKVALGQADKRLYMDESKDKKPGDEEQEVLEDIDINCWEFFCAMIESCFSCCSNPDAHPQPPCHAAPQPSGHAAPQSSGRATPASSHYAMPTSSHYAMPTSSGYAMPTSPGPAAEQLDQNIRWTG
ncbi:hypothetical protein BJ138DRAFT_1118441 [Hygrophoropsis aurantiaca]|uniref:Uncharacterized protein n=1 Tax=Hygrophoropsis aurantiaca TaxID=72124 RepID=A0ACB7ZXN0_9AGAM|nr:hypothetical protein BJ138DRAFT_1118441 [Hygrophoropsis aurantiaca]